MPPVTSTEDSVELRLTFGLWRKWTQPRRAPEPGAVQVRVSSSFFRLAFEGVSGLEYTVDQFVCLGSDSKHRAIS